MAFYQKKLDPADERSLAISQSIEAFVCYQLLYEIWWSHDTTTSALSNGDHLMERSDDANCNGEARPEGFWKVLLSEPHASFQATRRATTEIQSKVMSLVQQHNPSTDAHLSSETSGADGEKR